MSRTKLIVAAIVAAAWGLDFGGPVTSQRTALAGEWQGGFAECKGQLAGCDAARCNAYMAWGRTGGLDGWTAQACTADPITGYTKRPYIAPVPGTPFVIDQNGWGALDCGTDEIRIGLNCIPTYALAADACGAGGGDPHIGNPIDVISGAKTERARDLSLGVGSTALVLDRHFVSGSPYAFDDGSTLGLGWRTNFDASATYSSITGGMPMTVKLRLPNGRELAFIYNRFQLSYAPAYESYGTFTTGNTISTDRLEPNGVGDGATLTLSARGGDRYVFTITQTGVQFGDPVFDIELTEIANERGREWTLSYDANGVLTQVTDAFGASITFTYDADGRLIEAAGSHGVTATYTHADVTKAMIGAPSGTPPATPDISTLIPPPHTGPDTSAYAPAVYGRVLSTVSISDASGSVTPEVTTYHYENERYPFYLTGVTDPLGVRYATWTYDDFGRATSSQNADVDGAPTSPFSIIYGGPDAQGVEVNVVTSHLGRIIDYTIEPVKRFGSIDLSHRRLREIKVRAMGGDPAELRDYQFDFINQRPEGSRRQLNASTWIEKDVTVNTLGQPLTITHAAGTPEQRQVTYQWTNGVRQPTRILEPNLDTQITYDADGQPLTVTKTDRIAPTDSGGAPFNPDTRVYTYTYTAEGKLASENGPLTPTGGAPDDVTTYTYDVNGHLASVTDALGHVMQVTQTNGRGQPLRVIEPNGVALEFSYDLRGRLTEIVEDADGAERRATFTYDAIGQMTQSVDADGVTLDFTYDAARRLTQVADGLGRVAVYDHDAAGNVTSVEFRNTATGPAQWSQSSVFDTLGRLRKIIGGAGQEREWAYDKLGRLVEETDGLGAATPGVAGDGVTRTTYDALHRVISTVDRTNATTALAYDASNDVSTHTDPRSLTTSFVRNGFGEVVQEQSPDRGTRSLYRDERGLIVTSIDARGVVANHSYDANGWLVSTVYPNAPTTDEDVDITRGGVGSGGAAGQITRVDDEAGATLYAYAADGRISQITQQRGAQSYTVGLSLTDGDRTAALTYPSGREILFTYDATGEIASVEMTPPGGGVATSLASGVVRAPFGPVTGFTYGNGATHIASYDASYRLTGQRDVGTADIRHVLYARDANDNLLQASDQLASTTTDFTYDAEDRLLAADGPSGLYGFAYDAVGNRTLRAFTPAGGLIDQLNLIYASSDNRLDQVAAVGGAPARVFQYDSNGNATRETLGAATVDYAYNRSDRLAAIDVGGVRAGEYWYDHQGQLAIRQLFDPMGAPTATIHTVFDDRGRRIAEHDGATGAVLREYVWLDDRPLAVIDAVGAVFWVHVDWMARPVAMTDATQSVVWEAEWSPFGVAEVITDVTAKSLRFPGQWFQLESGLHQNHWRDYDATLGRYLQPDRLGLIDGASVYGYARQNPNKFVDPTGELGIVGGIVGGMGSLGSQLASNGGNISSVNWTNVGFSITGGAVGGIGLASTIRGGTAGMGGLIRGADMGRISSWKSGAVRQRLRRNNGITGRNNHIVHVFIPNAGWGKNVPDRIKNMRWNLGVGDGKINMAAGTSMTSAHFQANVPAWFHMALWSPHAGFTIDNLEIIFSDCWPGWDMLGIE